MLFTSLIFCFLSTSSNVSCICCSYGVSIRLSIKCMQQTRVLSTDLLVLLGLQTRAPGMQACKEACLTHYLRLLTKFSNVLLQDMDSNKSHEHTVAMRLLLMHFFCTKAACKEQAVYQPWRLLKIFCSSASPQVLLVLNVQTVHSLTVWMADASSILHLAQRCLCNVEHPASGSLGLQRSPDVREVWCDCLAYTMLCGKFTFDICHPEQDQICVQVSPQSAAGKVQPHSKLLSS